LLSTIDQVGCADTDVAATKQTATAIDHVKILSIGSNHEHSALRHWEGDLLSGSKNSYIATLVERQTRYVTLTKVANKDTQTVVSALIKQAKTIPNELYKSLTWDRGKELADHRRLTLATNIDVYFCDPQSPW
jgi:IS30 family transposase